MLLISHDQAQITIVYRRCTTDKEIIIHSLWFAEQTVFWGTKSDSDNLTVGWAAKFGNSQLKSKMRRLFKKCAVQQIAHTHFENLKVN